MNKLALIMNIYTWFLLSLIKFSLAAQNNACNRYEDYLTAKSNKNCFHNPEMFMETPQILKRYVSDYETHKITTEDGYILTMFRLPRTDPRGTILLQHPLMTNSRIYVSQGAENSIGLFLWNAGYDIWLNNMRGTLFSQKHSNLSFSSPKFWDFSLHEIGHYDIAAQVEYIKSKIGDSKIIYIGHSLGTTSGLIYASTRPEKAARSIKRFFLLATAAQFQHADVQTAQVLAGLESELVAIVKMINWNNFLFFRDLLIQGASPVARMMPILPKLVNLLLSVVSGWTPEESDPALINFDVARNLQTASTKLMLHYLQLLVRKDRFQMYDYGKSKNRKIYKSEIPPEYPLDKISVPVIMISSYNDSLTSLEDAEAVFQKFSNETRAKSDHWKVYGLNHMDFQLGQHKRDVFLDRLLDFINKMDE